MENYKVYIHIFPNLKVYIGITKQKLNDRWKNGLGYKTQTFMYKAINRYGWENIKHIVIRDNLTLEEAQAMEINLIKQYKSNQSKYGYNIANGGDGSFAVSQQIREKISMAVKGKTGHKWTEEEKNRHSMLFKNREFTDEWRKKISQSKIGNKNSMFGKKHTDEEKAKIAKSVSEHSKKRAVKCIENNTTYISISEAGRQLNISSSKISLVCSGKRKHTYNLHFKYVDGDTK